MGIRGLTSLIKKYVPDAIQTYNFQYFYGSRIAIDTSILLYKFRYSNCHQNSHISGFLNKCLNYIKHGIIPIFIIDGKPPPEKNETIMKRKRNKEKIEARIRELKKQLEESSENKTEILNKITKLDKQIITVNREHHNETHELLKILGFQVIKSQGEAEEVCASLQKNKIVNFTYSDDTDVLALGCNKVLRSNGRNNSFTEIDLEKVLQGLELTFDEFVDVCILCGCDYCPSIPKINYQRAYELIRKYNSIENVLKNLDFIPREFNYNDARRIFKRSVNLNHYEPSLLTETPKIDELRLYKFLNKRKYNRRYIDNYIRKFRSAITTKFPSESNEINYFVK